MKRKQLQYPDYNSFRRLRHEKMIFKTRFVALRFIPFDGYKEAKIVLYRMGNGGFEEEVAFPATERDYKVAIAVCEDCINAQLKEIEREFYEVDE